MTLAGQIRLGGPNEGKAHSGPLINEWRLHRLRDYIDEDKSEGAEVVIGSHRLDCTGYFVHRTVPAEVRSDMRLYPSEIFGPVVAVTPFDDELVAMANDTRMVSPLQLGQEMFCALTDLPSVSIATPSC